jgi:DNA-binding NarL/FixJ family response regulator
MQAMEAHIAPRVAIVDADRRVRQSLSDLLSLAGIAVVGTAGEPAQAAALLQAEHPAILLVDPRLPDLDAGEAFVSAVSSLDPSVRVVLMGWSDPMERPTLMHRAVAYLPKGSSPEDFVSATLSACNC